MTNRPEYSLKITINKRKLSRVIIDQHYKEKHSELSDDLILNLVSTLDGENFEIEETKDDFEYFVVEPVFFDDRPYRLILVLCLCDDYLGVINAFRVRRKK